jgi:hypothetical protein
LGSNFSVLLGDLAIGAALGGAMTCFHPLEVFQQVETGKVFFHEVADCRPMRLPCGKCIGCRSDRCSEWTVRCYCERVLHWAACVFTLTYDDEHLPFDGGLHYSHVQGFFRDLRKFLRDRAFFIGPLQPKDWPVFRFFMCGEYGSNFGRPHYHVVCFGQDFAFDRKPWGARSFTSETLTRLWSRGFVTIDDACVQSTGMMAYVAGHVVKKLGAKREYVTVDPETGECFSVAPEFIRMSLKPGIGAGFLDRYFGDVFPRDFVRVDGRKHKVPRAFNKLLKVRDGFLLDELQEKRIKRAELRAADCTPERLAVREQIRIAYLKHYSNYKL